MKNGATTPLIGVRKWMSLFLASREAFNQNTESLKLAMKVAVYQICLWEAFSLDCSIMRGRKLPPLLGCALTEVGKISAEIISIITDLKKRFFSQEQRLTYAEIASLDWSNPFGDRWIQLLNAMKFLETLLETFPRPIHTKHFNVPQSQDRDGLHHKQLLKKGCDQAQEYYDEILKLFITTLYCMFASKLDERTHDPTCLSYLKNGKSIFAQDTKYIKRRFGSFKETIQTDHQELTVYKETIRKEKDESLKISEAAAFAAQIDSTHNFAAQAALGKAQRNVAKANLAEELSGLSEELLHWVSQIDAFYLNLLALFGKL